MLLVPAANAWAHAALLRTSPQGSVTVNRSPADVRLTYSEAVEPRFAIVSVTDATGRQEASGAPFHPPGAPTTLAVRVRHLDQGWYLVYWRVISADGHPVRGAYTFAVGPNPGPAPRFVIPSLTESAATPSLISVRWVAFLAMMAAIGLFALRALIARPAAERAGPAARAVSIACAAALGLALIAFPVYAEMATATFALRSALDVGGVVPLVRDSALGRALTDLEVVLALFAFAAWAAVATDRRTGRPRSVAGVLSLTGALVAAGAALAVPGLAGHAAQTSPAGLSLPADWTHMAAGSLWVGGLAGMVVLGARLRREHRGEVLGVVVPRFSRVALGSVVLLVASGVVASFEHLPTLPSLWGTSYGKAIVVKVALLLVVLVLGGINITRTVPRLAAGRARGDAELSRSASELLRRTVAGELVLVAAIVAAAMALTSLPPPAKALGSLGEISAHVGPGAVRREVRSGPYTLDVAISPNRAAAPSRFSVTIRRDGAPVRGATVIAHFLMLDMDMQAQAYTLPEGPAGTYSRTEPALVMVGHWGLSFEVTPPGGRPFTVVIEDVAQG
jgi:copper transport protein